MYTLVSNSITFKNTYLVLILFNTQDAGKNASETCPKKRLIVDKGVKKDTEIAKLKKLLIHTYISP